MKACSKTKISGDSRYLVDSFPFLHGMEIMNMSESDRLAYEQAAFRYWRKSGFPFSTLTKDQLLKEYHRFASSKSSVFKGKRFLGWSPLGLLVANSFHKWMWWTKCEGFRTPMEVYNDDEMFQDCIRKAVRLWTDRRPLSPSNIRRMLSTYTNTKRVSNFRPTIARALFEKYSKNGDVILDPAAGYGGRMLGAFPLQRTYIGIDPNPDAYNGNLALLKALINETQADARLINQCAECELLRFDSSSVHLIIFSPPYFRRERYSNDANQSWVRYHTYHEWKTSFLAEVLEQCRRLLRPHGYLILNVANTESHPVADDTKAKAKKIFQYHYSYKMLIGSVPYHRNEQHGGFRYEPIYIYRKGKKT